MTGDADLASVAALLGERTRAAICLALLDGRFHTAGELAHAARVTASTASEHLAKLRQGRLVEDVRQGRHRYFRLAGAEVAAAIEALGILADTTPVRSLRQAHASARLRAGRTCYDHLAGRLGVWLADALIGAGVLTAGYALADPSPLDALGLAVDAQARRILVRPCLDWTERRYHVAGLFPAALAHRLLELGWINRGTGRAVSLTEQGRLQLCGLLQVGTDDLAG